MSDDRIAWDTSIREAVSPFTVLEWVACASAFEQGRLEAERDDWKEAYLELNARAAVERDALKAEVRSQKSAYASLQQDRDDWRHDYEEACERARKAEAEAERLRANEAEFRETIKLWMSKAADRYRPPYARVTEEFPRQCVFIGSTNADKYLPEPNFMRSEKPNVGGSRRFQVKLFTEWLGGFFSILVVVALIAALLFALSGCGAPEPTLEICSGGAKSFDVIDGESLVSYSWDGQTLLVTPLVGSEWYTLLTTTECERARDFACERISKDRNEVPQCR